VVFIEPSLDSVQARSRTQSADFSSPRAESVWIQSRDASDESSELERENVLDGLVFKAIESTHGVGAGHVVSTNGE
jgi:hypothetical protein